MAVARGLGSARVGMATELQHDRIAYEEEMRKINEKNKKTSICSSIV